MCIRVNQKALDCYLSMCYHGAQRRRAVPGDRECWVTPATFTFTRSNTGLCLTIRLQGKQDVTFCMFKLNMRLFVFSTLFNLYVSAEKGRALWKWVADFHGFRQQQSDRDELPNEEALQLWLTAHQWQKSNSSPPMADAPICETKAVASAHGRAQRIQI